MRVELVLAIFAAGCACGSDDAIAELVQKRGRVERDFARTTNQWESAARGAKFAIGDGVRTHDEASATLILRGGARLAMEPSTEIRFARGDGDEGRVEVATGSATLEAGDEESRIETDVGLAVLEPRARVRLEGRNLSVLVGAASIETDRGRREIAEGESLASVEARSEEPPPAVEEEEAEDETGIEVVTEGRVERMRGGRWRRIAPGARRMRAGTRLRLSRRASVIVEREGDRVRAVGAGVIVVAPSESELVESLSGRAHIEAQAREVRVRVPGGVIVASAASAGEVHVGERTSEVRVARGRMTLRERDAEEAVLEEGQRGEIARLRERPAVSVPQQTEERADLVLSARGGAVIHDPAPPTVVRFEVDCDDGTIELRRDHGALVHRLARGRHRYRVRCGERTRGRGRVMVLRDSGQARLPRAPPASIVDADGRAYTVLYQNQLPVITVRWRGGPPAGPYRLTFTSPSRPAVVSQRPTFAFASGELEDGTHRFIVEAGGARSEPTTLTIRFDNAAPTASVSEPANGSFAPGERVTVRGVALPGWSIQVAGSEVEPDASRRFETSVVAPNGPLVIRLSHPRHGVHYYLRRPRGG